MEDHRDIPAPSPAKRREGVVDVPPMQAMKLAVYQAMHDRGVIKPNWGERLGVDGRQVRRILDLDHATRLDHLLRALNVLGKRVLIDVRDAA